MRRLAAWLACVAGVAWVVRRLRRPPASSPADPADELRRKLDESRTEEQPAAGPPADDRGAGTAGLDDRRRAVHERARAAIDEMRDHGTKPS